MEKMRMLHKKRRSGKEKRFGGGRGLPTAAVLALAMLLVIGTWTEPAFAAGASDTPDSDSYTIQQAAGANGNTATVTLGKILTCSRANDFPAITDFIFTVEAVRGWNNANADTEESGEDVAAASMPMPAVSQTAHQKVTVSGTKATVLVGNFQQTGATNTSTGDGADTATKRTRTTPVQITFDQAGYYVYKMKEVGSIPRSTEENYETTPLKNVPGVDYDDNEYFMVFYVCNKVDAQGNTIDGVYVRSITSYTNRSGSDQYQPNLADIQEVTDYGGAPAGANTGHPEADGTMSHNLGKVGISDPAAPNQLEAYRMWGAYVTHDVVIRNNVTGNLGDREKEFAFTVVLTGLAGSSAYTVGAEVEETGDAGTVGIDSATVGTKNSASSFTADADGKATLQVKMKDDDVFVLNGLPLNAQYKITEAASDHVSKYTVVSTNTSTSEDTAMIARASGTNGTSTDLSLATAVERVDRHDATVTVQFNNNRDLAAITGVPGLDWMVYAGLLLIMIAGAVIVVRRRRLYAAEDEAEK